MKQSPRNDDNDAAEAAAPSVNGSIEEDQKVSNNSNINNNSSSSNNGNNKLEWSAIKQQATLFTQMALPYYKESSTGRWLLAVLLALTLLNSGVSVAFSSMSIIVMPRIRQSGGA